VSWGFRKRGFLARKPRKNCRPPTDSGSGLVLRQSGMKQSLNFKNSEGHCLLIPNSESCVAGNIFFVKLENGSIHSEHVLEQILDLSRRTGEIGNFQYAPLPLMTALSLRRLGSI
jgi:hypothetical protein